LRDRQNDCDANFRQRQSDRSDFAVKNVPFTISGVLTPKGLSTQGVDQDDIVIMPYTSAMKRVAGGRRCATSTCRSASATKSRPRNSKSFRCFATPQHSPGRDDDFTVRNQRDRAAATATTQ
jgi:putative ABC transport system permease protein